MGGSGTALGGVVGAALIEVIRNSLTLLGISTFWQGTFIGSCIVIAVAFDRVKATAARPRSRRADRTWPSAKKTRSRQESAFRRRRGDRLAHPARRFRAGRAAAQRGRMVQAAAHEPVGRARGHQDAEGQGAAELATQGRHARRAARALEPARSRRAGLVHGARPTAIGSSSRCRRCAASSSRRRRRWRRSIALRRRWRRSRTPAATWEPPRPSRTASRRTCGSISESCSAAGNEFLVPFGFLIESALANVFDYVTRHVGTLRHAQSLHERYREGRSGAAVRRPRAARPAGCSPTPTM